MGRAPALFHSSGASLPTTPICHDRVGLPDNCKFATTDALAAAIATGRLPDRAGHVVATASYATLALTGSSIALITMLSVREETGLVSDTATSNEEND
ncbi:hypothetical protein WJX84_011629 [Apatococcus fuscideae]|uniref:Uncharacterized protein n=1 Tax=Apatococcus fuscideae TaxID=2026836 RepID=A0AAW1S546_9CHLO